MKGDTKVIEYLNQGLRHELTAVNQFWLHYRLFDNWGYNELAKKWRKEFIEEMEHGDRFVDRILFLEGFPNMQDLNPLRVGQNVQEILASDLAADRAHFSGGSGDEDRAIRHRGSPLHLVSARTGGQRGRAGRRSLTRHQL